MTNSLKKYLIKNVKIIHKGNKLINTEILINNGIICKIAENINIK